MKNLLKLFVLIAIVVLGVYYYKTTMNHDTNTITQAATVSQIQSLSRLQTVAYSVDSIVTAQKQGSWQKLWQDEQKGLFVIKGRVLAGVDLTKITADDVGVHHAKQTGTSPKIMVKLPPPQVFEVFLDDIQIYDWQTGLFGMMSHDHQLFTKVQQDAKQEVLSKACAGNILTMAADNAAEQVERLFALSDVQIEVHQQGAGVCQMPILDQ
ncbi:DUF4230 domain-containing protein [Moraxella nasicaprae]|uniref:DUF4230 domain-containing protein n=1 Tax=Moraxella nasicaprae TaxID=2904122 RepID=A0ABY6F5A2_9GAMM|nr:DUF4230 domain-containing protein [Moraxella nasicaprae]UXZ05228.1 DUF4230 domain-containing protein [Moraxella nasicaprae]